MRRCAPNFCQDLGEASELITNAQRVASALRVYRAHTERIQLVYRAHMLKNPTNAQRVPSARNEWPAHAPRAQRTASERQLETRSALVQHAHIRCMFAGHTLEAR